MEEQIVLLMIAVSNGYGTSETCSSVWRMGEWCLRSAPSPPRDVGVHSPLSLWFQPRARGCGPGGQVAFAHVASPTLSRAWGRRRWAGGPVLLVPAVPKASAGSHAALLGLLPKHFAFIFIFPVQVLIFFKKKFSETYFQIYRKVDENDTKSQLLSTCFSAC